MSLLGIDIGTTGTKAIAFDETGHILSQAYKEYHLIHPRPEWSELDANSLWDKVKEAIREVNAQLDHDPIAAISISTQGEAVVPVDKSGKILHDIIVAFDNRTIPQCNWWNEHVGADYIFRTTGMPVHPMYSINKVMWFAESMPQVHDMVWKYFCVEDFIIYRLCGETAIDYSLAARTMAFDVVAKRWSGDMLEKAGIDEGLFSTPYASGTLVGKLRPNLAIELGCASDVAVVTGGHDQACGALGAGVIHEGMAINATGTVDVLCPVLSQCTLNSSMLEKNYCCYPHTYPNLYISVAFNLTGGLLLKWYRDILCQYEVQQAVKQGLDPYSLIIEQASPEPAMVYILPHFVGAGTPALDPKSKGAVVGLTISTKKSDLTRAVLDSINYEMRYNIECMQNMEIAVDELRVIGGAAKSPKWLQMKADVFGKKISVLKVSEAASLGAAILAGKAIERFSTFDEAVKNMVKVEREYLSNRKEHEKYQSKYDTYLGIYPALRDINQHISEFTKNI